MQFQQSRGYNRVHACWSEHSDSSFVYGFTRLIYGLGTMTTTTYDRYAQLASYQTHQSFYPHTYMFQGSKYYFENWSKKSCLPVWHRHRVASGPRVKLASCKSALNPTVVCSTDRSKAVVPVLVLLFVALWFILRGDLLYVFPCVILFLCFSVLLVLRLPHLGKRELILVLFVRLFGLCLFRFVGFLFLLKP